MHINRLVMPTGIIASLLMTQCIAGLIDCSTLDQRTADVNSDGKMSMVDAMRIAQYVAGLITGLQCSQR